jgi:hypothetical protein
MTNQKAQDIADWARSALDSMTWHPDSKSNTDVYKKVAVAAGLSTSLIRSFHNKTRPNPSVSSIDKIVDGIKKVFGRMAA